MSIWPYVLVCITGYEVISGQRTNSKIICLSSAQNFSPMLYQNWGIGGISQHAQYLLNRLYKEEMPKNQLINLALYVMTETMTQDGRVGGFPKVYWLQKDGKDGTLTDNEVKAILANNDTRLNNFRKSFSK